MTMTLRIDRIADPGIAAKERIVMKVLADTDGGEFAVFEAGRHFGGGVSNEIKSAYWFPDKKVSAGDLVILYSKSGTPTEKHNSNGSTSHFFYWGTQRAVWDSATSAPVLLYLGDWQVFLGKQTGEQ